MRFYQKVKPFFFKNKGKGLRQEMQPVKVSSHPDIVERIYARYPYVDKTEIAQVVLATFETTRDLLLKGCILNLSKFVTDCKIHFFQHVEGGTAYPSVKVKTSTPIKWKKKQGPINDNK